MFTTLLLAVVTACDWGREPPPCACPDLEAAVDSVDWADGAPPDPIGTEAAGGEEWAVQRAWTTEHSETLRTRIEGELAVVGFDVEVGELTLRAQDKSVATLGNVVIWIGNSQGVGELEEEFWIRVTVPRGEPGEVYDILGQLRERLSDSP